MNFTVIWQPAAERDLADLWIDAPDRDNVAAAADAIDESLQRDPSSQGESRGGDSRILVVPPLVVLFDVREGDRMVSVWGVFRWGRMPPD